MLIYIAKKYITLCTHSTLVFINFQQNEHKNLIQSKNALTNNSLHFSTQTNLITFRKLSHGISSKIS